jgi:hypothetical protein
LSTTVLPAANAEGAGVRAQPRVVELVRPAGVVEEPRGHQGNVDVAALLDGLAVVEALRHRELAGALLHEAGDPEQVLAAVPARHLRPDLVVRAACGRHGGIDIRLRPRRDGGDVGLVRRRDRRERRSPALDELAADEQAVLLAEVQDRARLRRGGVLQKGH